ncbi:hypothetical protein [Sphingobacterium haloxyli]|uniref:hypothetical protein n=1 Tax=Sphingobacterium haloxyli TaxID=2100533 RepID=UPI0013FD9D1E|nr:hypothetical protein [Sphingobacterium haloxyli]
MKQDKKMIYETPTIELVEVEMENGVAGGSAAGQPQINDWQDGGSDVNNVDF